MQCTNCGTQNEANYRFCMKCGSPLTIQTQEASPNLRETPSNTVPLTSLQPPGQMQAAPPHSPYPPASPQAYSPATPRPITFQPPNHAYGSQQTSVLNIWGPFAGFGTRRQHMGWLMDNRGEHTAALIQKVGHKFNERRIPEATLEQKVLTGRGLIVENRPYFMLQRGLATVGLYIAQFGRDLYVSLASYLKPPVSGFRVFLFVLSLLFGLFMTLGYPVTLAGLGSSLSNSVSLFGGGPSEGDIALAIAMVCVVGPLGAVNNFLLFIFFCYSIYKWFTEKDILRGLRVSPNEFNEDDLMAMEKAVEQTVRMSLDEIGLDPAELKPALNAESRRLI